MTRPNRADGAEWEAARDRVFTYHERELTALVARLRAGLERLDTGEIDVFEYDDLVHHYKRAAQKLYSFCSGTGSDIRRAARSLELADAEGEPFDWWEAGEVPQMSSD